MYISDTPDVFLVLCVTQFTTVCGFKDVSVEREVTSEADVDVPQRMMTDPDQESKRIVSKKQTDGPVLDVQVLVFRVTHLTEARHEEVVAAMIRRRVLFDVRKLHKLNKKKTLRHFRAEQH